MSVEIQYLPKLATDVAYDGLVKMHAQEIAQTATFRARGVLSTGQVHQVAKDLAALDREHELDATIELILAKADALELEREAQQTRDQEFRRRVRMAASDAVPNSTPQQTALCRDDPVSHAGRAAPGPSPHAPEPIGNTARSPALPGEARYEGHARGDGKNRTRERHTGARVGRPH